jgi:hypothetical protein
MADAMSRPPSREETMAESSQEKAARHGYSISKSGEGYALINEYSERLLL